MNAKFRGMTQEGKWLYGSALFKGEHAFIVTGGIQEITVAKNGDAMHMFSAFEVIPSTVGQWTGRVDKNGREIYERDVLECGINATHYVVWDEIKGQWAYKHTWCFKDTDEPVLPLYRLIEDMNVFDGLYCRVIGNICENPELLSEIQ